MANVKKYLWNILILLTQIINTVLLAGSPDETTSSRAYRLKEKVFWGYLHRFINWLFCDNNHCRKAYEIEVAKVESWYKHIIRAENKYRSSSSGKQK